MRRDLADRMVNCAGGGKPFDILPFASVRALESGIKVVTRHGIHRARGAEWSSRQFDAGKNPDPPPARSVGLFANTAP